MANDFAAVDACITLYEKPCGCNPIHSNYIPDGCWHYARYGSNDMDLFECRQCGAVWTYLDAKSEVDRIFRVWDNDSLAHAK